MSDIGIDDDFMRDLGASLKPGSAAVFFLTRKITADKVIDRMARFHAKGHVLQTSLNENIEASLSAALEPADP